MLRVERDFLRKPPSLRGIAEDAGLAPETVCRLVRGKQKPSYAEGGSAERIAAALGFEGDPRELFEEVER